jgi:hypothetical protein
MIGPQNETSQYETRTAVWQCPRCHRVQTHTFSIYTTYGLSGSLWCPCYSLRAPAGCVERREITKMMPLNKAAQDHEEMIRVMAESRRRAEEYQDSWGHRGMS